MKNPIAKCCLAVSMALCAGAVSAAGVETWDLTTGDPNAYFGNNIETYIGSNGTQLSVRAFYADNLSNVSDGVGDTNRSAGLQMTTAAATLKSQNGSGTIAGLGSYGGSGLGISNPVDTPMTSGQENYVGGQHAVDNFDTYNSGSVNTNTGSKHAHDFMLFDFSEVMELANFRIGWKAYDNTGIDFFVAPDALSGTYDVAGKSIATLISEGWTQVSYNNVADCVPGDASCPTQFSNGSGYTAGMKSRYIIAAGALGGNDDAFKFAQISMSTSSGGSNPTPGTAALLAIGLAGFAASRRKGKRA